MNDRPAEILIRQAHPTDLEGIVRLFLPQKRNPEALNWVLTGPDGKMRSLVAEADGRIVGHLGYIENEYRFGEKTFRGVFSIEWIVDPAFGQAGLKLYSQVMKMGDFTYVIGGTKIVNEMYPLLRFHVPLEVKRFLKVMRPLAYGKALDCPLWKKVAKTLWFGRTRLIPAPNGNRSVSLTPYEPGELPPLHPTNMVVNAVSADHFDWLCRPPTLTAHRFTIRQMGRPIGTALVYVEQQFGTICGRIVHISHLGDNPPLWQGTVRVLEQFLVTQGCCIITTLASAFEMIEALEDRGHLVTHSLPFWLRDRKKHFAGADWHLTYLEGDLAYRGLYLSDFTGHSEISL